MLTLWMCFLLCWPALVLGNELKLVHAIFSHKLYAPVQLNNSPKNAADNLPRKLNYRFFLEQTDDMNNEAKMDLYNFGVFLRDKYDGFLGEIYYPEIMRMRTSEYVLSMISGQLVDAGLWPPAPAQKWDSALNWQPVVTDYVPAERDTLLLGTLCPSFKHEHKLALKNVSSTKTMLGYYEIFNFLSEQSKFIIDDPSGVELLYSSFETLNSYKLPLPDWGTKLFTNGSMESITLSSYELLSYSTLQKQLNGGTLLKQIIKDTLADKINDSKRKLKISLYSGEERNLIGVLQSMDLWKPHILNPVESLIFEIYQKSPGEQYTVKLNYYDGDAKNIQDLTLPGCGKFCPIDEFEKYLHDIIPKVHEKKLCELNSIPHTGSGVSLKDSFNYYLLPIIIIQYVFLHL
ncbi:hypothetical protein PV327_000778 [Microctonus hyperodae]|uniref:acid phosphatase n=1 Tax=Microctonus hyperodae TaxID=165561 RepID=A0AA39L2I0_MICHY|nr:hypothetical protein PV327_000778 [Microctonus hyperodae]